MPTHPGQERSRPTAAPWPSVVSSGGARRWGQNRSSCFPQVKGHNQRRCSLRRRRGASEVGPKSATLTTRPSLLIDGLISWTQYGDWSDKPYLPHQALHLVRTKLLKRTVKHSNSEQHAMQPDPSQWTRQKSTVFCCFSCYLIPFPAWEAVSGLSDCGSVKDCKGRPIWLSNHITIKAIKVLTHFLSLNATISCGKKYFEIILRLFRVRVSTPAVLNGPIDKTRIKVHVCVQHTNLMGWGGGGNRR